MKLIEVSSGITHIEDLGINDFIGIFTQWDMQEATEKLDGAQILFGIDSNGFYTSRETKGGQRVYNESEYDIRFPTTYMRATHILLERVLPVMKEAGLRLGDQVEAEVLYGLLPNVVPYSEDINYLIFLRTTEGRVNIDHLKQKLDGQSLLIPVETPYTRDGRIIESAMQTHEWNFSRSPVIDIDPDLDVKIIPVLEELTDFLSSPTTGIPELPQLSNETVYSIPLNKTPSWCQPKDWKIVKEALKEERAAVNEKFMEYKIRVKTILLDHFVRQQASVFGPSHDDGGWIEGVVLKNVNSGKMVKIVDKDVFTATLREAWTDRNALTEAAKGIYSANSFMANLLLDMATSVGHPELGTIQAKAYLRKQGMITEERLQNLSEGIHFDEIKQYWSELLVIRENQLQARLDKYEAKEVDPSNNAAGNHKSRLDYAIKQRTLETFAETFRKIFTLQEETAKARTTEDLFQTLVGKQLGEI